MIMTFFPPSAWDSSVLFENQNSYNYNYESYSIAYYLVPDVGSNVDVLPTSDKMSSEEDVAPSLEKMHLRQQFRDTWLWVDHSTK